jgi:signal transduction histidine kinase
VTPVAKRTRQPAPTEDHARLLAAMEELAESNRRLINREYQLQREQFFRETFNRIVTRLISPDELKKTLTDVLTILCEATESATGAIYLLAPEEKRFVPIARHNSPEQLPALEPGVGLLGFVTREKKQYVSGDIPATFPLKIRLADDVEVPPRVVLIQPLLRSEQILGVLVAGTTSNYLPEMLDLVARSAVQIAIAILNAITLQRAISLARELKFKSESLRERYQELERAHQLKTAFLAAASHELKTPLNAIIGFANVLLKQAHGPLTPRQQEYAQYIRKNGDHLLKLINDILDLSRIDSGKVAVVRRRINLGQLLRECAQSIRPLADRKSQQIEIRLADALPAVRADRNKLKQIIFNLLSNAIKFAPADTEITLQAQLTEFGDEVRISVSDRGPGIPAEDQDKIFEPFVRSARDAQIEGTGLGLALVRRLVELHHGRIWVESAGTGSTFHVTLPVAGFEVKGKKGELVKARLMFDE